MIMCDMIFSWIGNSATQVQHLPPALSRVSLISVCVCVCDMQNPEWIELQPIDYRRQKYLSLHSSIHVRISVCGLIGDTQTLMHKLPALFIELLYERITCIVAVVLNKNHSVARVIT